MDTFGRICATVLAVVAWLWLFALVAAGSEAIFGEDSGWAYLTGIPMILLGLGLAVFAIGFTWGDD